MEMVWQQCSDSVADKSGAMHRILISPYNGLDADATYRGDTPPASQAAPDAGTPTEPLNCFGLKAEIEDKRGNINAWLLCSKHQWGYFVAEGEAAEQKAPKAETLQARRSRVLQDFVVKAKLAFRAGQILPGDEIQVRLAPDASVPPYGLEWRRALREE